MMVSCTFGGESLGTVTDERITAVSGLIIINMPMQPADSQLTFEGSGVNYIVTVTGYFSGSLDNIKTKFNQYLNISNGWIQPTGTGKQEARSYVSDLFPSGILLKIMDCEMWREPGKVTVINYSMKLALTKEGV